MATITEQVNEVHLSKVQTSTEKAKNVARAAKAFFEACEDLKDYHQANQGGEYGSHGAIFVDPESQDPDVQERHAALVVKLDDEEGFIKDTGVTRADHAGMIALAFDVVEDGQPNRFETEFRRSLILRVGE